MIHHGKMHFPSPSYTHTDTHTQTHAHTHTQAHTPKRRTDGALTKTCSHTPLLAQRNWLIRSHSFHSLSFSLSLFHTHTHTHTDAALLFRLKLGELARLIMTPDSPQTDPNIHSLERERDRAKVKRTRGRTRWGQMVTKNTQFRHKERQETYTV